ncbi:hypothetical protein PV08_08496 [Exophiala spinifera]|uniref:Uncharacterized protein n=1 Tax=Exophiala spinifera TaxID=91928 RepID=A0A0D2B2Z5_9EURO|nr:uncharacterized protein PV08_08496 [Exophiala spinifera]KIW13308.1 hypothetical protein PV08_08496 [Exophiala spinifera]
MDLPKNFIPPSPPASAASPAPTTTSFTGQNPDLPTPRSHRLRPGSPKEIALINYLDDKILRITRRYAKKFSDEMTSKDDAPGYTTYDEFVADVDPLVDVAWVSGTPTLQVAYLLSLAGLVCSYMPAFPFSTAVFYITGKLDRGFTSLLQSSSTNSPDPAAAYHVSMTEKVRIKSLVEETRITAVNVTSSSGLSTKVVDVSELETEEEEEEDTDDTNLEQGPQSNNISRSLALSKIYKRTLEILGDSLDTSALLSDQEMRDAPMTERKAEE